MLQSDDHLPVLIEGDVIGYGSGSIWRDQFAIGLGVCRWIVESRRVLTSHPRLSLRLLLGMEEDEARDQVLLYGL
jgi:hypothetical protein